MKNTNSTFHPEIISYLDSYSFRGEVKKIKPRNNNQHYYEEEQSGICVVRRKDESVEDLMKRFRRKFAKSGISKEVRERMYFEKPGQKKRRKIMRSIQNIKREKEKIELSKEKYYNIKKKGGSFKRTDGDKDD